MKAIALVCLLFLVGCGTDVGKPDCIRVGFVKDAENGKIYTACVSKRNGELAEVYMRSLDNGIWVKFGWMVEEEINWFEPKLASFDAIKTGFLYATPDED